MTPMRHTNRHNAYSVTRQTPLCGCCSDLQWVWSSQDSGPALLRLWPRPRKTARDPAELPQLPVAPDQKCSARGPRPGLDFGAEPRPRRFCGNLSTCCFAVLAPFGRHFRSPAGMAFLPVTYRRKESREACMDRRSLDVACA